MANKWKFLTIILGLFSTLTVSAAAENTLKFNPEQEVAVPKDIRPTDVIHWTPVSAESSRDGTIKVALRLSTDLDFSLYTDKVKFLGPNGTELIDMKGPEIKTVMDPIEGKEVSVWAGGDFELFFKAKQTFTGAQFPLAITYLGCTTRICLFPFTETIQVPTFLKNEEEAQAPVQGSNPETKPASQPNGEDLQTKLAGIFNEGKLSFGLLLLLVFFGGLLTNLTPCVYPMIPITLRLLGANSSSPLARGAMYSLGIVFTYTSLGIGAALTGGLFGSIMASTWFSLGFALTMIALGVSMLGFGSFAALQNIGARIGNGKQSLLNTFFQGTAAGLVASPCTGPILAALLAYTAKNQDIKQSAILLSLYSFGFALPYMFLGGAAAKVSKIKLPHQLQIAIKGIFASVMFALGLYYLRVPAYSIFVMLKGSWAILTAGGLILGVILTSYWVLNPHLHHAKGFSLIPTAILAMGIFSGTQWLTGSSSGDGVYWMKNEAEAYAKAKETGKPLLIDAWAEWCEACKKMDAHTFTVPEVVEEVNANWIALKFDLTNDNEENNAIQTKYNLTGLPTLTLVPANGDLEKKSAITGEVNASTLLKKLSEFKGEK